MNKCIHASIKHAITAIKTPPSKANPLLLSILATTLLAGCGGSDGEGSDDSGESRRLSIASQRRQALAGKSAQQSTWLNPAMQPPSP
ncbi:hypothetical protein [Shewanella putrefaciens]|uniref:hypothetical protein n=1 Tax=Shewanella putrefaciens TaxID=24 RepID=UPI0013E326FE|nr:hypothetical protein [Shewanella putrefaciens]